MKKEEELKSNSSKNFVAIIAIILVIIGALIYASFRKQIRKPLTYKINTIDSNINLNVDDYNNDIENITNSTKNIQNQTDKEDFTKSFFQSN